MKQGADQSASPFFGKRPISLPRLAIEPDDFRHGTHGFFMFAMGLFGFLHWIIYLFSYGAPAYPTTHLTAVAGLTLMLFPLARAPFLILVALMATDSILQAPVFSNHTILKNFLLLGILVAGVETLARRENWDFFVQRFALVGRWLLLIMYFYGVFHKINTSFLDPSASCAGALWQDMPFPGFIADNPFFHVTGIWATFIIESAIVALLLFRTTRYLGIFFGIAFHSLLALSAFGFYPAFSTLTIALHCLFLPARAHQGIADRPRAVYWLTRARSPFGLGLAALIAAAIIFYASMQMLQSAALAWFLIIIPFALMVLIFGRDASGAGNERTGASRRSDPALAFRPAWIPVLALLFLFNGATPYFGLKTAQSLNMFANLHLEGGRSNHLILTNPPGPFTYLDDLVEITDSHGIGYFNYIGRYDYLRIVHYDFLNHVERAGPGARVSYIRNGVEYRDQSYEDLKPEMEQVLHPRWFRAWFHFIPVDMRDPKPCARNR